jgi:hypothetical protein
VLFEMLLKRFDSDHIKSMVPPTQVKLIEHIRKCQEREARKKAENWAAKFSNKEQEEGEHTPLIFFI